MLVAKAKELDESLEQIVLDEMTNIQKDEKKEVFDLTSKNQIKAIADRSNQIIENMKRIQRA
jgi:hypothetical protein